MYLTKNLKTITIFDKWQATIQLREQIIITFTDFSVQIS